MSLYPKQPTGPSSLGTAQVRALDARGGDYQRSWRDSTTQVLKQGEFRKVLVGADQYIADGQISETQERTLVTPNYRVFFRPTARIPEPVHTSFAGIGRYLLARVPNVPSAIVQDFDYTALPSGYQRQRVTLRDTGAAFVLASFYGGEQALATINHMQYQAAALVFLGYNFAVPVTQSRAVVAHLTSGTRTDAANKPLFDVAIYTLNYGGAAVKTVVNHAAFTDPGAEFAARIPMDVSNSFGFALLAEEFFRKGYFGGDIEDYRPKFWLLTYPGKIFTVQPTARDITAAFPDGAFPEFVGSPPSTFFGANTGAGYNNNLFFTMSTVRFVVLPANVVLICYRQFCDDNQWHGRIARVNLATGASELVYDAPSGLPGSFLGPFIGSAVHLGAGRILAKQADDLETFNRPVKFLYSSNGGSSWSTFDPSGFDAPLTNQFFGNFTVELPRSDDAPGVVLMPSWDGEGYRVYESQDDGATWERRSSIVKPDTFRALVSLPGAATGSFENLLPGPNPARAIDPALPGRHTS